MEKGKSSTLMNSDLPRNSVRVSRIAITTPKTVLMGTATSASSSVNFVCGDIKLLQNNDSDLKLHIAAQLLALVVSKLRIWICQQDLA